MWSENGLTSHTARSMKRAKESRPLGRRITSTETWVWVPSANRKSWSWWCAPVTLGCGWGSAGRWPPEAHRLASLAKAISSRFSERRCLTERWGVIGENHLMSDSHLHRHVHTCICAPAMVNMYTIDVHTYVYSHTRSTNKRWLTLDSKCHFVQTPCCTPFLHGLIIKTLVRVSEI